MLSRAIVERETSDLAGVILGRDDIKISTTGNAVGSGFVVKLRWADKFIEIPLSSADLTMTLDELSERILVPRIHNLKSAIAA